MFPHRRDLTVAVALTGTTIVGCARSPRPQPAANVASAAVACEREPLRSEVARLREMERRAHALIVDTTVYTRLQLQLERVMSDTAVQGQLDRLMVDTALYTRLDALMADTAFTRRRADVRMQLGPRVDSLSMRLDSLLTCLSLPTSPRR